MKKFILVSFIIIFLIQAAPVNAQMMGRFTYPSTSASPSDIQSQQQEEQEGKDLLDKLKNKSLSCAQLSDKDFEKIGEYFMGQSVGDTNAHIAMNNRMKAMMGESGEEQMHVFWGRRGSGCEGGGVSPMMGWGFSGMMNGGLGWGLFGAIGVLFWVVFLIDLILVGIWLWKQIQKK